MIPNSRGQYCEGTVDVILHVVLSLYLGIGIGVLAWVVWGLLQ